MEEKCHACHKPFENHDEYNHHVMNIHPVTQRCSKCQGIMKIHWDWDTHGNASLFEYICSECGFVGDRWHKFPITDPVDLNSTTGKFLYDNK